MTGCINPVRLSHILPTLEELEIDGAPCDEVEVNHPTPSESP
jgi:hypothetical protein